MKPDFALSLSYEGIGLLRRVAGGWHLLGEVALDDPDLGDSLGRLRASVQMEGESELACKVIIPNEQIRYLTLNEANADKTIASRALDGATPYDVADLQIDVSSDGNQSFVAAVARETLDEAAEFATTNGFKPVCFVACPEEGAFLGEPFFGTSVQSFGALLSPMAPEPDDVAVKIISSGALPVEAPVEKFAPKIATAPLVSTPSADASKESAFPSFSSVRASRGLDLSHAPANNTLKGEKPSGTTSPDIPIPKDQTDRFSSLTADKPRFDPAAVVASLQSQPDDKPSEAESTKSNAGLFRRKSRGGVIAAPKKSPPKPATDKTTPSEKERASLLGTRADKKIGPRPPKILALVLTLALLAFLAIIAVWATVFLDDGLAGIFKRTPVVTASEPAVPDTPQTQIADTLPLAEDITDSAEIEALDGPEISPPANSQIIDEVARYAVTGIWAIAPVQPDTPAADALSDLYIASIDPDVVTQDALALTSLQDVIPDVSIDEVGSPVAAGTLFELDERGFVIASPQGVLSPLGVLVYTGRPAALPLSYPDRSQPALVAPAPELAIAKLRPRLRPTNLVEQNERARQGGRSNDELAAIRPQVRPQSAKALAEADETATARAVAVSLKPRNRPANIQKIVAKARVQAPVATPAVAIVTPSIPTTASVARQATQQNELNLRKINLIGVYGSSSERRALVRMANGRYKKVQVGDRMDGGRVAAIGETELRYIKSGKNIVLKMPKG